MRKRAKKMGRPPKRPSERKSKYVPVRVESVKLKSYQAAADSQYDGNLADFIRAACDALAEQIKNQPPPSD